jgi:hypothetical protein
MEDGKARPSLAQRASAMADSVRLFERELAGEASRSSLTMQDERRLVSHAGIEPPR